MKCGSRHHIDMYKSKKNFPTDLYISIATNIYNPSFTETALKHLTFFNRIHIYMYIY